MCEISHLVDTKQQSGSPNQQVVNPHQQNGTPNQQVVIPLQQNGTSRIHKMGCANCIGPPIQPMPISHILNIIIITVRQNASLSFLLLLRSSSSSTLSSSPISLSAGSILLSIYGKDFGSLFQTLQQAFLVRPLTMSLADMFILNIIVVTRFDHCQWPDQSVREVDCPYHCKSNHPVQPGCICSSCFLLHRQ